MQDKINSLVLSLNNGGQFDVSFHRTYMFKFEYDAKNGMKTELDERSGAVRKLAAEVVNEAHLKLEASGADGQKYVFVKPDGSEGFANIRPIDRPLTSGAYDPVTGTGITKKTVRQEYRGNIRIPIAGTNIVVISAGMTEGNRVFVYVSHPDYRPNSIRNNATPVDKTSVDKELDDIL